MLGYKIKTMEINQIKLWVGCIFDTPVLLTWTRLMNYRKGYELMITW